MFYKSHYLRWEFPITHEEGLLIAFIGEPDASNGAKLFEYIKYADSFEETDGNRYVSLKLFCYFNSYNLDSVEDTAKIVDVAKSLLGILISQEFLVNSDLLRRRDSFETVPTLDNAMCP